MKEAIEKLIQDHLPVKTWEAGKDWVQYSGTYYDHEEYYAAINSIMKGWFGIGPETVKFERGFAKLFNKQHALFTNSGSSANLLMVSALASKNGYNFKKGTKIVTPIAGFPTTINPIFQVGFEPVFVDIEIETLNIDTTQAWDKVDRDPDIKALMFAYALGNCPDMGAVMEIVKNYDLLFLEDCCDALGTTYNNHLLGSYGVMATCSLHPAHHLSCGSGGIVASNDDGINEVLRSLRGWGSACFTESAPVYTKEGVKKITEVKIGDEVLTHEGRYRKVYELTGRNYTGDLYTIRAKGQRRIECTADHPFYIMRDDSYQWITAKDVKEGDYFLQSIPSEDNDLVLTTTHMTQGGMELNYEYPAEPELIRLIGYFLAEGALSQSMTSKGKKNKGYKYPRYRTDFAFNVNEHEYIQDVVALMRKYFNTACCYETRKGSNGISLKFNGHKGFEFFNKYCGRKAWNVRMPWYFLHLDNSLLKELIKGYWRGDGHDSFQSYSFSTVSPTLFEQVRLVLTKLGIASNVNIRTKDKHKSSIVRGRLIEQKHDMYTIVVYRPNADKLKEILVESSLRENLERPNHTINRKYITDDKKYAVFDVEEISKAQVSDIPVYNFEVEEDHSYHAYGVISHNCHCVGKANFLADGSCGCRFSKWIPEIDEVFDHKYVYTEIGYNLKPIELQASVGIAQIKKLPEIIEKRKRNHKLLWDLFAPYDEFILHPARKNSDPSWFAFPVTIKDGVKFKRHEICRFFESHKIQTRQYFGGNMMLQPSYRGYMSAEEIKKFPVANKVMKDTFFLGVSPVITPEMIDYIGIILKKFMEQ